MILHLGVAEGLCAWALAVESQGVYLYSWAVTENHSSNGSGYEPLLLVGYQYFTAYLVQPQLLLCLASDVSRSDSSIHMVGHAVEIPHIFPSTFSQFADR